MSKKKDVLLEKVLRDFNREVEQIKKDLPWPPAKKNSQIVVDTLDFTTYYKNALTVTHRERDLHVRHNSA